MRSLRSLSVAGAALMVVAMHAGARAEYVLGVYGGWNGTHNSDVRFTDPDTDWTVQNIPWLGLPFTADGAAPYYGARFTYWMESKPHWGFMLDYTHAKVRADPSATVNYGGTIDGAPFSGSDQVGNLFDMLEFTDGISLLTLNAMYRFEPIGRLQPYVGAGLGLNIPHVEVEGNGGSVPFDRTFDYELGGPAAQLLAGVDFRITDNLSLFTEYKFSWAGVNAPLTDGYRVHTNLLTHHILAGISLTFGGD